MTHLYLVQTISWNAREFTILIIHYTAKQQVCNSSYLTERQINRSEAIVGLQHQQQHPGHLEQQLCYLGSKHLRGLLNGCALLFVTRHVQMINVFADDLQSKGSCFDKGYWTDGPFT